MLDRASVEKLSQRDFASGLLALLGVDVGSSVAVAPLAWWHDSGSRARSDCWRADPVHIRVGTRAAGLVAPTELGLDRSDADALVATIVDAMGWPAAKLVAPVPDRWYLHDTGWQPVEAVAPAIAAAGDPSRFLPRGPGAAPLQRLMSEIQIVLNDHPVNRSRLRQGQLPVNSVWLWGGGASDAMPRSKALPLMFGNDPFLGGLAKSAGQEMLPVPLPSDTKFWSTRGDALVLLSSGPAGRDGSAALRLADWLAAARRRLLTGKLVQLRLADAHGCVRRWGRLDPLKIWRRAGRRLERET